jgi:hypothetical protein
MGKFTDHFKAYLKNRLEAYGAVAEFCKQTGFARNTVEAWIDTEGGGSPTLTSLDIIEDKTDMKIAELLGLQPAKEPPGPVDLDAFARRVSEETIRALAIEESQPKPAESQTPSGLTSEQKELIATITAITDPHDLMMAKIAIQALVPATRLSKSNQK